jgi:hypothetical protein
MKTLTKMFLLSCWCLLSVSFAKEHIDQIKANEQQQIIQQKLDALEDQVEQKKQVKVEEKDCEELILPTQLKDISVPEDYNSEGPQDRTLLAPKHIGVEADNSDDSILLDESAIEEKAQMEKLLKIADM